MNCPRCKTPDKFHQAGTSVFCVAKIGGRPCWYTLTHEQGKIYFAEKRASAIKKKRTEYFRLYYKEHRRKYKNGITIAQIAAFKLCDVSTVWRNKNKFDILPGAKPSLYKFNDKIINWLPKKVEVKND